MSFELFIQTYELKNFVKHLSTVISVCDIYVDPIRGLCMEQLDSSVVCFYSFQIAPDSFEIFEVEKSVCIGVKLESFHKILSMGQKISLKKKHDSNTLEFSCPSGVKGTLSLLDLQLGEPLSIPPYEGLEIPLRTPDLHPAVCNLAEVGDIEIRLENNMIKLSASSTFDIGNLSYDWPVDTDQTYKGLFGGKKLSEAIKLGYYMNNIVSLITAKERPLCIKFSFEKMKGHCCIYIAPKVDTD